MRSIAEKFQARVAIGFVWFDLHASPLMLINCARSRKCILSAIVRTRRRTAIPVSQSSEAQCSAAQRAHGGNGAVQMVTCKSGASAKSRGDGP